MGERSALLRGGRGRGLGGLAVAPGGAAALPALRLGPRRPSAGKGGRRAPGVRLLAAGAVMRSRLPRVGLRLPGGGFSGRSGGSSGGAVVLPALRVGPRRPFAGRGDRGAPPWGFSPRACSWCLPGFGSRCAAGPGLSTEVLGLWPVVSPVLQGRDRAASRERFVAPVALPGYVGGWAG